MSAACAATLALITTNATPPRSRLFMASSIRRGLLHDARSLRLRWLLFLCRRDHERGPHVPAVGPMRSVEFLVALEIDVALIVVADLEDMTDLRSDADDARFEATDPVATPAIAGELIVKVADEA